MCGVTSLRHSTESENHTKQKNHHCLEEILCTELKNNCLSHLERKFLTLIQHAQV